MRRTITQSAAIWFAVLTVLPARAQDEPASARVFVQRLLDWYAPRVQRIAPRPISTARLDAFLSPDLAAALAADRAAQARVKGDLVGLDFDPVLGTQDPGDPGDRFAARQVQRQGAGFLVDVYFVAAHVTQDPGPLEQAVLMPQGKGWRIVNFVYPPLHTDLKRVLAQLAQERRREPHRGR